MKWGLTTLTNNYRTMLGMADTAVILKPLIRSQLAWELFQRAELPTNEYLQLIIKHTNDYPENFKSSHNI